MPPAPPALSASLLLVLALLVALGLVGVLALRLRHLQRRHRLERQRLDHILDGSPVVTYVLEPPRFAPSYVSGNLHRLLGSDNGQLLGNAQWWRERLHPLDRDATVARFEHWWAGGGETPLRHAYRMLGADNATVWVEDTVRVQRDEAGRPQACIGAIVDVTERHTVAQRLRQLTESVPGLICQIQMGPGHQPLRLPYAGAAALGLFGFAPEQVADDAGPLLNLIDSEDRPGLMSSLQDSARALAPWHHQFRLHHPELGLRWISGHARPERLDDGSTLWHGMMNDVTERKRVEHALSENERQMRALIDSMDDMVLVVDAQGVLLRFHQPPRMQAHTGVAQPAVGQACAQLFPAVFNEALAQAMLALQVGQAPVHTEVGWPGPEGEFWLAFTFSAIARTGAGGMSNGCLCVGSDMSERRQREAELTALATTDALTRLPNRRHFLTRLEDELGRVHRYPQEETALLMLDLDHFKQVNDRWGHNAGDRVLRAFADVLHETPRGADLPGRVGGEEFALLLPNTGREPALAVAERIRAQVGAMQVAQESGPPIAVTVSIGVTRLRPGDTPEAALQRADLALYDAKHRGRNRVEHHWD